MAGRGDAKQPLNEGGVERKSGRDGREVLSPFAG
jgi:hypothetical protein